MPRTMTHAQVRLMHELENDLHLARRGFAYADGEICDAAEKQAEAALLAFETRMFREGRARRAPDGRLMSN